MTPRLSILRAAWPLTGLVLVVVACDAPAAPYGPASMTPRLLAVTPDAGSIHGGARIRVTVEDITIGAVLKFGPTVVGSFRADGVFVVPSGTAGSVDVIVDNLNGHTAVLSGGFRYVDPGVFDANGIWQGSAFDFLSDTDVDVDFTVEGSVLTRFLCSGKAAFTPDVAIPIANGAFSYASGDGLRLSGRLVAERQVAGTADLPGCPGVYWSASRR